MIHLLSGPLDPVDPSPGTVLFALINYTVDRELAERWNQLRIRTDWPDQSSHNMDHFERARLEAELIGSLVSQLQSGTLIATGISHGSLTRELVPDDWWAGIRTGPQPESALDIKRGRARNFGLTVYQLRILRRADPEAKTVLIKSRRTGTPRDQGGRPRVFDDKLAAREIIRSVLQGGIRNKRQLKAHLLDWAAREYAEPPDDKTVQRWIADYWPDDLPKG